MRKTKIYLIFLFIFSLNLISCASVSTVIEDPNYSPGFTYRMMRTGMRIGGVKKVFMDSPENVIKRSARFNKYLSMQPPDNFYKSNKMTVSEIDINGNPCYIITPIQNDNIEKAVVFLHGGGFVIGIQSFHWKVIKRIVNELNIPVIVPLYPLYPEINPQNIINVVDTAFNYAYQNFPNAKVTGFGDSAGAYLLLSYCHYLTEKEDARFPDKLICVSPAQAAGIDEQTKNEMKAIDKKDVIIPYDILHTMPALYNMTSDETNWFTTPLYGDFKNFPPMTIFTGTHEIFYPLIPPFVENVKSIEKEIELYVGYNMMHIWPMMPMSREAKFGMDIILDVIKIINHEPH